MLLSVNGPDAGCMLSTIGLILGNRDQRPDTAPAEKSEQILMMAKLLSTRGTVVVTDVLPVYLFVGVGCSTLLR